MNHAERRKRRLAIAKYASQHGKSEAAIKFGVTYYMVSQSLMEHGLSAKEKHSVPTSAFTILKSLLDGVPACDIARTRGITKQRVSQAAIAARKAGFDV